MSTKLKECPACGKEVSKSAKVCPHCGKKLKMGLFLKFLILLVIIGIGAAVFGPSQEEKEASFNQELTAIKNADTSSLSPEGKLAETFQIAGTASDIQRDTLKKEIIGKIVQWRLPFYNATKFNEDAYKISTRTSFKDTMRGVKIVDTELIIYPQNDSEDTFINNLKEGDLITIKGKITGVTIMTRAIEIEPAILIQ